VRRAAAAIVVASVGAACSALTNLDDLRGEDGSATDANADVASGDVAVNEPSDAAPTSFCPRPTDADVVYCESFDDGEDAATLGVVQSNTGTVTIDDADFVSPPASLLATIGAADGGTLAAGIKHATNVEPMRIWLDLSVREHSLAGNMNLLSIEEIGTTTHTIVMVIGPTHFYVQETLPNADGGTVYVSHTTVPFNFSDESWHAIHFVLDLDTKTDAVSIDGTFYESNYALQAGWVKGLATLSTGVTYSIASDTAWSLRVDNVLAQMWLE